MIVRTITTPAGQTLDVIPDAQYVARSPRLASEHALRMWSAKRSVLGALWLHGPAEDASGLATRVLHERASELGYAGAPSAVLPLLRGLGPAVTTETQGRRTYRIELGTLPESWARKLLEDAELTAIASEASADVATEAQETSEEPEATESAPEPSEVSEELTEEEPWNLEVTGAVAMALLTKVVEIVSAGSSDEATHRLRAERDDARHRLHEQTERAERLRREIREVGDELGAVKHERDGLRTRLKLVESNLRKATGPDVQRTVDALVREQVDKLMRAAPAPNRGAD